MVRFSQIDCRPYLVRINEETNAPEEDTVPEEKEEILNEEDGFKDSKRISPRNDDSFNDESVPGFCINGAFVKPLYVDSDDCETFRFAIDALEKLERVEQMIDKANRVYDDVNWWIAVSDIEKTVKGGKSGTYYKRRCVMWC